MLGHELFPGLREGLLVGRDGRRGWFVQADRDLPPGEIICIEQGTVVALPDLMVCDFCLQPCSSPYCSNCSVKYAVVRQFEEPFLDQLEQLGIAKLAYRTLLRFDAQHLESVLQGDTTFNGFSAIMALTTFDIGKLDAVENFCVRAQQLLYREHPSWSKIGDHGLFKRVFDEIVRRLPRNAHTVSQEKYRPGAVALGTGLFPVCSLFNHSCRANVFSYFKDDTFYFVSKGVKKGEELLDNYGLQAYEASYDVRKNFFEEVLHFSCFCDACITELGRLSDYLLCHESKHYAVVEPTVANVKMLLKSIELPKYHLYKETAIHRLLATNSDLDWSERKSFIFNIIESQTHRGGILLPEQVPYYLELMVDCALDRTTVAEFEDWIASVLFRLIFFVDDTHPLQDTFEALIKIVREKLKEGYAHDEVNVSSLTEASTHIQTIRDYVEPRSAIHVPYREY